MTTRVKKIHRVQTPPPRAFFSRALPISQVVAWSLIFSVLGSTTVFAAPIEITPDTLPDATVGVSYLQTLTASTTDSDPFAWSISSGALPVGLTIGTSTSSSATISGTPTVSGPSLFTLSVQGAGASTTNKTYTLTTASAAPATSSSATLNVIASVINNDGGPNTVLSDFTVFVSGAAASPASFHPSVNATTSISVTPGMPYQVSVPTQTYTVSLSPDCSSSIAAGDEATCHITLDDIAPLPGDQSPPNLVANPLLEIQDPVTPSVPDRWFKGYDDGGAVVEYTYPATNTPASDISSGNAAKITVSRILPTSTDAKWYFKPVSVTPGVTYAFSDSYIATTPTEYVAAFCTDVWLNNCSYAFATVSKTPDDVWKQGRATFTVPAGKSYMTVFHRIQNTGTLTVDTYSLTAVPPPAPFGSGFVSLAFDDGFASQFTSALPALNTAGLKGTFYIITHAIAGLSIVNASLEASAGDLPTGWAHSGAESATYTYATTGAHTGARAGEVTADTEGSNAAWYFTPVTVIPDEIYSYTGWYRSTAPSSLSAQLSLVDGTLLNATVMSDSSMNASELGESIPLPDTGGVWTQIHAYFYMPTTARSVTVLNRLTGAGTLAVDDVTLGIDEHMTRDQVATLQDSGEEIGAHTQTHPDLTSLSVANATTEIAGGIRELTTGGITTIQTIAYPYGANNQAVQDISHLSGLSAGRGITPGWNGKNAPPYALLSQSVNADTNLSTVESWVSEAKADHTWLILTFHEIDNDLTKRPYGTTPGTLASILSYLNSPSGLPVKTVREGVALMNETNSPAPVISTESVSSVATTSITIAWTTDHPATSCVIYDTISHTTASTTEAAPTNYGYLSSSIEDPLLTTQHAVTVSGLLADTTYYLRAVSHGSSEAIGSELRATTNAEGQATTTPPDTLAPIITLTGANPLTLTAGSTFTDPGATVTDNHDATRTITGTGTVATSTPGTYVLTYTATDSAGNTAIPVTRTVIVQAVPTVPGGGSSSSQRAHLRSTVMGLVLGIASSTPSVEITHLFTRTLSRTMCGDEIRELQKILIAQQFLHIPTPTSYFGVLTRAAVMNFQRAHGLPAVGSVGPLTRALLNQASR